MKTTNLFIQNRHYVIFLFDPNNHTIRYFDSNVGTQLSVTQKKECLLHLNPN